MLRDWKNGQVIIGVTCISKFNSWLALDGAPFQKAANKNTDISTGEQQTSRRKPGVSQR